MSAELRALLADRIEAVTRGRLEAASLSDASSLASLESVEVLELVVVLEERLAIQLAESDLAAAHWQTFGQLLALLVLRRAR